MWEKPRDYYHYIQSDIACQYFWEDQTQLTAFGDKSQFAQEVEDKLKVPSKTTLKILSKADELYHKTSPIFLENSLHKVQTYLTIDAWQALKIIYKLNLTKTLHQVNTKQTQSPKFVQLLNRFATYNGSSPYLTPGIMSMIPHLEHNVGTFFPRGGMQSITKALHQLALDLGVTFHLSTLVEEILVEKQKAIGLKANGQTHHFDILVSNMDIVPTYRKLLKNQPAPEKVLNQPRSSSALIFYWGIKAEFPELDLHNIFFSDNYQKEFAHIFEHKTVSKDPTVYVNISSKLEKADAPNGCENWFVMVNVPGNTGQDWNEIIDQTRENVLKKLERILNKPVKGLIETEDILDPRSIEQRTQSFQGSLYGSSSNNMMAAFLRHPNFSQKIRGLYFCGGSVHPGGGIPLCLLSAKITASLIKKKYGRQS